MELFEVSKNDLNDFLVNLSKDSELYAPMKKSIVRFQKISATDVPNIYLEKNTYFPIKELFFKKNQVMFEFKDGAFKEPKLVSPKIVVFGLRRCDLNGIMHQDKIYMQDVKDPYYSAARKNSILIGYHCNEAPSQYCFCGTLNLKDFYDLMVYDMKDKTNGKLLIEVGTEKGKKLLSNFKNLKKSNVILSSQDKKIKNADRLLKDDISGLYDNPGWKEGVDKCLSCAACTNLCPTCYCFEIHDKLNVDGTSVRTKEWSSCQLQDFTRVAGNHVFRQKRDERFKHRIYHQLEYFKEKNGVNLCVGCGRCISGCPTRIDFVDIINKMKPVENK